MQIQRMQTKNKTVRSSYLVFSIVVFREMTSIEQKSVSCSSSSSVESSAKGTARSLSKSDGVSNGVRSDKPFSSVFLKDQGEHSTQAYWFWI
jgi:hypothetical protein